MSEQFVAHNYSEAMSLSPLHGQFIAGGLLYIYIMVGWFPSFNSQFICWFIDSSSCQVLVYIHYINKVWCTNIYTKNKILISTREHDARNK